MRIDRRKESRTRQRSQQRTNASPFGSILVASRGYGHTPPHLPHCRLHLRGPQLPVSPRAATRIAPHSRASKANTQRIHLLQSARRRHRTCSSSSKLLLPSPPIGTRASAELFPRSEPTRRHRRDPALHTACSRPSQVQSYTVWHLLSPKNIPSLLALICSGCPLFSFPCKFCSALKVVHIEMGSTRSKNEDDKALVLCQERKRYVREALDGRCALAAAHFAYIQSLRHTGFALKKFVEPEVPTDSSLYTSTSATPEPPATRHKSTNLSTSVSRHASDSFSPAPSPLSSGRFHVNHMKAGGNPVRTIEEKVPVPVTATLQTSSPVHSQAVHDLGGSSTFEAAPGTPPWDYFGLFHPVESHLSFDDEKGSGHDFQNADDIRRLREKEGIPELEEEGEKPHAHAVDIKRFPQDEDPDLKDGKNSDINGIEDEFAESEDDFENPSSEPLVRMFKNRNDAPVENTVSNQSPAHLASEKVLLENIDSKTDKPNDDKPVLDISMYETDESPVASPIKEVASSISHLPMNGKSKEPFRDVRNGVKDLYSCMKEVEILFIKASDSGKEVPRMLEADKIKFRPLLPEERAHGSKASGFFATFFACCGEEVHVPQPPPQAEVRYLTWHRSVSSQSSSSRNPLGQASNADVDGLTGNIFSGVYMNSGSHASTLDRLYAWERKLCDEVKASGTICRQYDEKCKQLRHQESRGETQMSMSIDRTRAAVKDLYSRISVAIQRIDMISKNIEDLRDKELQPQLEELIGSLTRMWETMLECHRHQHEIIKLLSNNGNMKVLIRTESQFQATLVLQVELNTLCSNFQKWIASHRSYLHSLNSWLLKCVKSLKKKKKGSRKKKEADISITDYDVAPIFKICEKWIQLLDGLPTKDLVDAFKGLVADINQSMPRQEKRRGELKEINRNVSLDIQSSFEAFLGKLELFSYDSLEKYTDLKEKIDEAKQKYEDCR